ncbi:GNAT family N-acetyltransferase [Actinospica robiniae]|uniref:GNAT family N-acetyltransferase n=1 Tax=Actinospica robiniae TaxID=304901 RepID=UPI000551544C|nr:GNAT family N-acetyltransferase [Actinospica robiniae]
MAVSIREPLPSDAADLGRAHAAAWQITYKGVIPDEVLETYTPERRTRMWERVIARPREAREHIAVAEIDGAVVGFAWTSACRDEGSPDSLGELQAINVAPSHLGTGVGLALIESAHRALAEAGFADSVLWVLPDNARARRFYELCGWRADGVERALELQDGSSIPEIRYGRDLTGIAGAGA